MDGRTKYLPDHVFDPRPALINGLYLPSAFLELRKALIPGSDIPQKAPYQGEQQLPNWLQSEYELPPWEADLLARLFDVQVPLLMIRGGSGCGKTSTAKFLVEYCKRSSTKTHYGDIPPLLYIDLNNIGQDITQKKYTEQERNRQVDDCLQEIGDKLLSLVQRIVSRENMSRLYEAAIINADEDISGRVNPFMDLAIQVREEYYDESPDGLGAGEVNVTRMNGVFKKFTKPAKFIQIGLLLLREIGRKMSKKGKRFTIIIDNIDPLPEFVQAKVLTQFRSTLWELRPVDLRIAIFVRLSTFAHSMKAHRIDQYIEFHSVDPADVVLFRITSFLLTPDRYWKNKMVSKDVKELMGLRILHFWMHLTEPSSACRRMLSGMAGTNIRNAMDYSAHWCLSKRLPTVFRDQTEGISAFKEQLATVVGMFALSRFCQAVERAVAAVLVLPRLEPILGTGSSKQAARSFAKRLAHTCWKVAEDACLIERRTADHNLIRKNISSMGIAGLKNIPHNKKNLVYLSDPARRLWGVAFNISEEIRKAHGEEGEVFIQHFCAQFSSVLKEVGSSFLEGCNAVTSQRISDFADLFSLWINRGMSSRNRQGKPVNLSRVPELRDLWSSVRVLEEESTNRYLAESILVQPEPDVGYHPTSALNVFSVDGRSVSPIPLCTLFYLLNSGRGTLLNPLTDHLRSLGFDIADIDAGFTEMFRNSRRVIFSGIRDQEDTVRTWNENPGTYVHISSAGASYVKDVVMNLAYLQWALLQPNDIKLKIERSELSLENLERDFTGEVKTSINERLAALFLGFESVIQDEIKRVREQGDSRPAFGPSVFPCSSIFRHFKGWIISLLNYDSRKTKQRRAGNNALKNRYKVLEIEIEEAEREIFRRKPKASGLFEPIDKWIV